MYRRVVGSCHILGFFSLSPFNNIEFNQLIVADTSQIFLRVILYNRSLMDKYIFVIVVPVYKTIAVPDIEPLHLSCDFLAEARVISVQSFTIGLHRSLLGNAVIWITH